LRGPTSKGRGKEGERGGKGGKEREGRGKGNGGRSTAPRLTTILLPPRENSTNPALLAIRVCW